MQLYHLHPIAVHFPIALLITALAEEIASLILQVRPERPAPEGKQEKWFWLVPSAEWFLWLGTIALWIAVGFGLLAEETAPHIPKAWEVLAEHKTLGFWSVGLFSLISLLRFHFRKEWRNLEIKWRWWFVFFWMIAVGILISTAFHGGELVFSFGMGSVI